jgi:hypothetical protein
MPQLNLTIDKAFQDLLKDNADATGTTPEDVIRKAVATYDYLRKATVGQNKSIAITNANEVVEQMVDLPQ